MKKKTWDMTQGPMLIPVILFSLPIMASNILQLTFNAADTMVVGHFAGDNCLAAVGSTSSLTGLLTMLFIGLSVGTNVICGQRLGAKDEEGVRKTVHTSIVIALASGLFLTVFGILISKGALRLMNSPDDVIDLATLYMRIIFVGMPANLVYNFGSSMLRANGDTKRPLYCLLVTGAMNVLLNLLFVIVFKWNVAGVALATIISQYLSAAFVLYLLIKDKGMLHLDLRKLGIDVPILKDIIRVGLPSGIQSILMSISNVFIQTRLNSLGKIVLAGSSASSSVENYVYAAIGAFGQANVAFTSQNYGAKKIDRIHKIFRMTMVISIACTLTLGVISYSVAPYVFKLYTTDARVVEVAMERFFWIGLLHVFGCVYDIPTFTLRGMGYSAKPMLCSLIGICGFRVCWMLFAFPLRPEASTIFMSYPMSWFLTGVIVLIMLMHRFRIIEKEMSTNE